MSKRQQVLQPCCRTAKRPRPQQQHVYLVVDDWERGYSVRKLDVLDDAFDSGAAGAGGDLDEELEPLPEPPVVRFDGPHCYLWHFGAHGTIILAMPVASDADSGFPVFDTATLGLALCPHPDGQKVYPKPVYVSVADKMYMLAGFALCVLHPPPPRDSTVIESTRWSWTVDEAPAPMKSSSVVSTATHPDGRMLFVSEVKRTFTLDIESLGWTCQGRWVMPFRGQAFFDEELDAWVGLCRHPGGIGYVCCCDVPPVTAAAADADDRCATMPAWKLGKDRLFSADYEGHLRVTLLCLGNSDYCLIEKLTHKDCDTSDPCRGPDRRVLKVTRFGLKYDKNGELRTTRLKRRSYEMTEGHNFNDLCMAPVAFWM